MSEQRAERFPRSSYRRLLKAFEAAHYLGVSEWTLSKMERDGLIIPYRTPGGHRRYSEEMLDEYLEASRQ